VVARFKGSAAEDVRRMENNRKAWIGKEAFLANVPGALEATGVRIRAWLGDHGLAEEVGARWIPIELAEGFTTRWVNVGRSTRCVDALEQLSDGRLRGVELKVSGRDGVSGLTLGEERLLRAGAIRVLAVNPVRGLIGEMDAASLLAVPRRADGVPVGQVFVEWIEDPAVPPLAGSERTPLGRDRTAEPLSER
jgi:hypothetical protein